MTSEVLETFNFKADGAIGGGIAFAIVGDHENRPTDMTNLVVIGVLDDEPNKNNKNNLPRPTRWKGECKL